MSEQEQSRTEVIRLYVEGYIKQHVAAKRMRLGTRQVRRLSKDYRLHGAKALIHGNRGKVSNRKIRDEIKYRSLALVRDNYHDFGPTFAAEKLLENHAINISSETLRQWMISDGIWQPKNKKKEQSHPMRERRPRMGELVQIDGTPHDWFEGRSAKCSLIVFIDDATSRLLDLQFYPWVIYFWFVICSLTLGHQSLLYSFIDTFFTHRLRHFFTTFECAVLQRFSFIQQRNSAIE